MIVASMSEIEKRDEIVRDLGLINRRYLERFSKEYDKFRRRNNVAKTEFCPRFFEFRTPAKNNWIVLLSKAPATEKYKGPESASVCQLVHYSGTRGLRVFRPLPNGNIAVYTGHFFSRYNERMKHTLTMPIDKVKHFFSHNGFSIGESYNINGNVYVIAKCHDGYCLGIYKNKVIVYRTFISNNLAWGDQVTKADKLLKSLLTDIQNRKMIDRDAEKSTDHQINLDVYKAITA